ncbi:UNVERIFIED_CONTAM: hypothetical protein NY603_40030, partial [Bacteroidetes bacterium 56_B9]
HIPYLHHGTIALHSTSSRPRLRALASHPVDPTCCCSIGSIHPSHPEAATESQIRMSTSEMLTYILHPLHRSMERSA